MGTTTDLAGRRSSRRRPTEPSPRRRILLIEDDDDLRAALAEALGARGHEVVPVADGRQALDRMRSVKPDIVVLDLMMPVLDGWQFRVEQKRDPVLADTPVVAVSASRSATAAAVDADLYLQKPVDVGTLLAAIEHVLQARARKQEPARIAQTERMAALGTLAAGLAHEINNPLTYVLIHLTQAARLLPALDTHENHEQLEQLRAMVLSALEGVERIRGVTAGIRTFSRVEDDFEPSRIEVRPVLEAALKIMNNEIRHRARLVCSYAPAPAVLANEGRLGQVFLNLLANAVQATPEGQASANEIRVSTATDAQGRAVVEIGDTGQGIAPHLLARIFEPFFSTKPVGQGTGLGLSISHGIVSVMGGEIQVASEPGRGAIFRVIMPAAPPLAPDVAEDAPAAAEQRVRRRILVVDDEPGVCAAIEGELGEDHDVVTAANGGEALDRLRHDPSFDVILCDLHMPDVTGMDLLARLRQTSPELAERVIFMTAGAFTERARQFLAATGRPAVEKPLDLARVRQLLEGGGGG